jgi:hypothetical protein
MCWEDDHGLCVRICRERSCYVCRFYPDIVLVGSLFYDAASISVYATPGKGLLVHCKGFGMKRPDKIAQTFNTASASAEILTRRLPNQCDLLIRQLAWSLAWRK